MGRIIQDPRPRDVAVYVSASLTDFEEAKRVAKVLRGQAVEVTSTWHEGGDKPITWVPGVNGHDIAARCFTEILQSDWMIVLSTDNPSTTGGMHVELGFAIGIKRPIVMVGNPKHPFHCLPCVKRCGSIEEFLMGLMTARVRGARMMSTVDRLRQEKRGERDGQGSKGGGGV